jgi:hypothetical protein
MISATIFLISVAALVQFFVGFTRSLVATYSQVEISPKTREVAGLPDSIGGDEFRRLVLLAQVYPGPGDDHLEIRAVSAYYAIVNLLGGCLKMLAPRLHAWTQRERAGCAYFAAVTLERRIAAITR